jgi:hypothetical protein
MHKIYLAMALLMSLVLGTGFAVSGNTVSAQSYGYDNYSNDDKKYSTYQTHDKPYECQKGPFKGFYVSSVEFCKPIDDRHDDKDGKDFPRQFEHKYYTVVGDTVTGASGINPNIVATAECDEGDSATGGSFTLGENGNAVIRSSGPEGDDTWKATAFIEDGTGPGQSVRGSVTADVRCFDNKPFHQEEDPLVVEEEAAAALVLE